MEQVLSEFFVVFIVLILSQLGYLYFKYIIGNFETEKVSSNKFLVRSFLIPIVPTLVMTVGFFVLRDLFNHFILGYPWADWTGFGPYEGETPIDGRPPTLWDWLQLLIIPIALTLAAYWFNRQERAAERVLTAKRFQDQILQDYLDNMTELLLEKDLRDPQHGADVRSVARSRTLAVLRLVDGERKGEVIRFLYEAKLIGHLSHRKEKYFSSDIEASLVPLRPVISLSHADLANIQLIGANLAGISLMSCRLAKANLSNANLEGANLSFANLSWANLEEACLERANLVESFSKFANLKNAVLRKTNLANAALRYAVLVNADLEGANLEGANLDFAYLNGSKSPWIWLHRKVAIILSYWPNPKWTGLFYSIHLAKKQLLAAHALSGVTLPDGTKVPEDGDSHAWLRDYIA